MGRFLARRLSHGLLLIAAVMAVTFLVFQVIGDPARRILPLNASDAQVEQFREANGYADPVLERFARFSGDVLTLDFGESYTQQRDALPVVLEALPRSVALAVAAMAIVVVGGLTLGLIAAMHPGGLIDRFVVALSVIFVSLAEFWVGLVLIVLVAVRMDLVPTSGYGLDSRILLPALTLALAPTGRLAFFVRNSINESMHEPHVAYATLMGVPPKRVMRRHVLRNASLPVLALGGLEITRMLVGGAIVVETVFAWPGIGRVYSTAMQRYDLPLVTATLFVATILVLGINILLDVLYARIDPRVVR